MNDKEISNKSIITSKIKIIRNKKIILDKRFSNISFYRFEKTIKEDEEN